MTIYKHLILTSPLNTRPRSVDTRDFTADWLNEYSEIGWEFVSTTHFNGNIHYIFRKPVEKH